MTTELFTIDVSGLRMALLESHDKTRYTLVFTILSKPKEVSITYLGKHRDQAWYSFRHKVECHRALAEGMGG